MTEWAGVIDSLYKHILFDLDGTLTDPAEGILHSLNHTMRHFGKEEFTAESCRVLIGPPILESFQLVCGFNSKEAAEALRIYRQHHLQVGLFENKVYPGIAGMLEKLRARGCRLYVATLKLASMADAVLQHLGLRSYFTAVVGAREGGGIPAKTDIIAEVLAGIPAAERVQALMVGDRKYDIIGARENWIASVAVLYGYGSEEELLAEKPDHLVRTVAELEALLAGLSQGQEERTGRMLKNV
ncbi:MAG: HAD hydrolase-like protein [Firmicutes bacterium]|nr:HAD hydrolase-like protein [Bacillota bacterium]